MRLEGSALAFVGRLGGRFAGFELDVARVKPHARSRVKAVLQHGRDWTRLADVCRATLECPDVPALLRAVDALTTWDAPDVRLVALEDRYFGVERRGYRYVLAHLRFRGVLWELQLSTPHVLAAKRAGERAFKTLRYIDESILLCAVEAAPRWLEALLALPGARAVAHADAALDRDGQSALHHAVAHGNVWLVRQLLELRASPWCLCSRHRIPLFLALENEQSEIRALLVERMLDLIAPPRVYGSLLQCVELSRKAFLAENDNIPRWLLAFAPGRKPRVKRPPPRDLNASETDSDATPVPAKRPPPVLPSLTIERLARADGGVRYAQMECANLEEWDDPEPAQVTCVAELRGGQFVTGDGDGRLTVFDADTAEARCWVQGHEDAVTAVGALDWGFMSCGMLKVKLWKEVMREKEPTPEPTPEPSERSQVDGEEAPPGEEASPGEKSQGEGEEASQEESSEPLSPHSSDGPEAIMIPVLVEVFVLPFDPTVLCVAPVLTTWGDEEVGETRFLTGLQKSADDVRDELRVPTPAASEIDAPPVYPPGWDRQRGRWKPGFEPPPPFYGTVLLWTVQDEEEEPDVPSERRGTAESVGSVPRGSVGSQKRASAVSSRKSRADDLARTSRHAFCGHGAGVTCCVVLPRGRKGPRQFLSAAEDGDVCLWSLPDQLPPWSEEAALVFSGHEGAVTCLLVLSADRFVSGGADRTVRVWSTSNPTAARVFSDTPAGPLRFGARLPSDARTPFVTASDDSGALVCIEEFGNLEMLVSYDVLRKTPYDLMLEPPAWNAGLRFW